MPIKAGGMQYGDKASQKWDINRKPTTGDILNITATYEKTHDVKKAADQSKISFETAAAVIAEHMQDHPDTFRKGKSMLWKGLTGELIMIECMKHAMRKIPELDANKAMYTAKIAGEMAERYMKAYDEQTDTVGGDEEAIKERQSEVEKALEELEEIGSTVGAAGPETTAVGGETGPVVGQDAGAGNGSGGRAEE